VESLGFIPLAGGAGSNKVKDHPPIMLDKKIGPEALKSFLDAFMRPGVCKLENVVEDLRISRDEHQAVVEDDAVAHAPAGAVLACCDRIPSSAQVGARLQLCAQVCEELEGRHGQRCQRWLGDQGVQQGGVAVPT